MSASTPNEGKIDNIVAVEMRENEDGQPTQDADSIRPRRWAGVVVKNDGEWSQGGNKSGEYRIEIFSNSLKDTVTARVNEDRQVGEKVQFLLAEQPLPVGVLGSSPITPGRFTESTFFESQRKHHRSGELGEWEKNDNWRQDMDDPSVD